MSRNIPQGFVAGTRAYRPEKLGVAKHTLFLFGDALWEVFLEGPADAVGEAFAEAAAEEVEQGDVAGGVDVFCVDVEFDDDAGAGEGDAGAIGFPGDVLHDGGKLGLHVGDGSFEPAFGVVEGGVVLDGDVYEGHWSSLEWISCEADG